MSDKSVQSRESIMDDNWKLEKIREFASSEKPYRPPKEVKGGNSSQNHDLDEIKLHELKEVSKLNLIAITAQINPVSTKSRRVFWYSASTYSI